MPAAMLRVLNCGGYGCLRDLEAQGGACLERLCGYVFAYGHGTAVMEDRDEFLPPQSACMHVSYCTVHIVFTPARLCYRLRIWGGC